MSRPFDRPTSEPGGMACDECGVVFVGAERHDKCAVCAAGWHPIITAPLDGTPVRTGTVSPMSIGSVPLYPLTSRFIDGKWCANFGKDDWRPYDPQPTRWQLLPAPTAVLEDVPKAPPVTKT